AVLRCTRRLHRATPHGLDAAGCVPDLVDRVPDFVLDVLVTGEPRGGIRDFAARGELLVDGTGRGVCVADVVAQLLVPERALDVGPGVRGGVGDPVLRVGHL